MYCNCCRTKFPKRENIPFRGIAAKFCDLCLESYYDKDSTFKNKRCYCISCGDILEKPDKHSDKISRIRCINCLTRTDIGHLMTQNSHMVNIISECDCAADTKIRHHFDYSRPYDVVLLCSLCHFAEHRKLKENA